MVRSAGSVAGGSGGDSGRAGGTCGGCSKVDRGFIKPYRRAGETEEARVFGGCWGFCMGKRPGELVVCDGHRPMSSLVIPYRPTWSYLVRSTPPPKAMLSMPLT